jgi:hypothetical protein
MKNLANYNDLDNIGSVHWFRTLVSQAKHIGEFINNQASPKFMYEELIVGYGKKIENIMSDLIEWQETNKPLFHEK